ncbi:MAG: type II toxin-antitoxin system YafQ family toxin [Bacilli bacterium]|nr:type II toxin-antitoxin system YafQ family toxin [Bacilli bacterium]
MKYELVLTNTYKDDLKKCAKRGKDIRKLTDVVDKLLLGEKLDKKYKDHKLAGNLRDYRECHIEPDWSLIHKIVDSQTILVLLHTGKHSELFK